MSYTVKISVRCDTCGDPLSDQGKPWRSKADAREQVKASGWSYNFSKRDKKVKHTCTRCQSLPR